MTGPVRIQLSRRKGFRLQEASLAANGLPCIKVDRTTKWGNPHDWRDWREQWPLLEARPWDGELDRDTWCRAMAYEAFAEDLRYGEIALPLEELAGKNLACWCPLNGGLINPCHADVLLELANPDARRVAATARRAA